jgi:hypothetical protein
MNFFKAVKGLYKAKNQRRFKTPVVITSNWEVELEFKPSILRTGRGVA